MYINFFHSVWFPSQPLAKCASASGCVRIVFMHSLLKNYSDTSAEAVIENHTHTPAAHGKSHTISFVTKLEFMVWFNMKAIPKPDI